MLVNVSDLEVGMCVNGVGVIVEVVEVSSMDVVVNVAANPADGYNLYDYDTVEQYLFDIDEVVEVFDE